MEKLTTHYCIVCKKKHEEEDWRWKKSGKKFYCHHGINCAGCGFIHYNESGSKITSKGEFCRKHYSTAPTLKQRLNNMSPEEVVSGGLIGSPNQFGTVSEDYTDSVREQNRKEVLDALK